MIFGHRRRTNNSAAVFAGSHRNSIGPTMSSASWSSIANIKGDSPFLLFSGMISPQILNLGNPPTPNASDDYQGKWKKLILMELHDELSEFKRGESRRRTLPEFKIQFLERKGDSDYSVVFSLSEEVVEEESEQPASQPAELMYSILRLPNTHHWLFVTALDDMDAKKFPASGKGILYSNNFLPSGDIYTTRNSNHSAYLFESFTSFMYRFRALDSYDEEVDPKIKRAIESGVLPKSESNILPPPSNTKLNPDQLSALGNINNSVDYIHGPPGTGKSTIISEYVKHRIPKSDNILVCTTTNKAIDSLVEKFKNSGYKDEMLAFGNESKLGEATALFLLSNRVKNHPIMTEMKKLEKELVRLKIKVLISELERCSDDAMFRKFEIAIGKKCQQFIALCRVIFFKTISNHMSQDMKLKVTEFFGLLETNNVMESGPDYISFKFDSMERSLKRDVERIIVATARIFVCTAATAVRLPERFRNIVQEVNSNEDALVSAFSDLALEEETISWKHVILDEAGAMLEPDVVGTIIHGCRKLLLVGDSLQLPPFTKWRDAEKYKFNVSLLQRFSDNENGFHNFLSTQYRMHPEIAQIASSIFYEGRLKTAQSTIKRRVRKNPALFVNVKGLEVKRGTSYVNYEEVDVIMQLVRAEKQNNPRSIINVIVFHKPQMYLVKDNLRKNLLDQSGSVDVITVDSMQGREADVIILSCVRCGGNSIGFLSDRKRLNVAITRAKEVMYVVGNSRTLKGQGSSIWKNVIDKLARVEM